MSKARKPRVQRPQRKVRWSPIASTLKYGEERAPYKLLWYGTFRR